MPKVQKQVYSRPPWERMMRMHQLIKDGKYPNCSKLAREFEVATRTIKRDVDFMRDRLNLPIEYDSRRYGFYYSKPVDQFPGVAVTEAEVFALLVAHKAIAQYHGTPFEKPLKAAFEKLTSQLDRTAPFTLSSLDEALSFRPFAPEDTDLKTFEVLSQGVREHRVVRFQYKKLGARKPECRHVQPHHLACIENVWYLFAHDVDRGDMRTFVLTRLTQPELTGKRFARRKDFNADEYLRGSLSVFRGGDDFEVVIEFDAWATDLIRGRKWHVTQEITELPDGCSRLRVRLNNIEEMERWVLSWGRHATVVRPKMLLDRILQTAMVLQKRYSEPDKPGKTEGQEELLPARRGGTKPKRATKSSIKPASN
jgi:proteasome accessory factor B